MSVNPEEVSSVIKKQLESYESELELEDRGIVLSVGDGIARVFGLENCMAKELVEFPGEVYGMAMNLEEENVGVVLMGESATVEEGDTVRRTGRVMSVPVGNELVGRVVNPLGQPLDGEGEIPLNKTRPIDIKAPGVTERQPVEIPLETGIKAIDSMIPIGRGQRELIIGDRKTGKTTILIDTILNQRRTQNSERPVICIYVAIGQKRSTVARTVETLRENDAMEYSIVVSATASEPPPLQYIAPYAGCAMGEEFLWQGEDVLICYDDLSKHADAYRTLSLLLRRPPGREAYPGDVFYLHSRLLERACKLNDELGAGSLTALPVIETKAGDVSAFIPTNVISITDGQIYLEPDLFYQGVRPAINVGLSVSRVGGAAQTDAMGDVSGQLRLSLAQYRELEAFAQFGQELDPATQKQLARGERMTELLKQSQHEPVPEEHQIVVIYAGNNGYLDRIEVEQVQEYEAGLIDYVQENANEVLVSLRQTGELTDEMEEKLDKACQNFTDQFVEEHEITLEHEVLREESA